MKLIKLISKHLSFLTFSLILCFIDQITKVAVVLFLKAPIAVTSFFNLVKVSNTGVSFGMFSNFGEIGKNSLIFITAIIVCFLIFYLFRQKRLVEKYALSMIIGGAIGNLIDRFYYGWVVDFLDFHIYGYHWPAFNFADTWIVVGGTILLFDIVFAKKTN